MVVASSTIVLYDSDGALLGQGSVHGTDTVSWERRPFRDNREALVGLALLLSHHTTAGSTRLLPGASRLPRGHRMSAWRDVMALLPHASVGVVAALTLAALAPGRQGTGPAPAIRARTGRAIRSRAAES
jgi:hypothetical protein